MDDINTLRDHALQAAINTTSNVAEAYYEATVAILDRAAHHMMNGDQGRAMELHDIAHDMYEQTERTN